MAKNKFWRIIAIVCGIYIAGCLIGSVISVHNDVKIYYKCALIPLFAFLVYSEIHQMRFPLDLRLYIVWSFIFSYMCVAYGSTALSMMIYYSALFLGTETRVLKTHRKLKLITAGVLYILFALFQLRLTPLEKIDSLMQFLGSLSTIVVMHFIVKHLLKKISSDILLEVQKENLDQYFEEGGFTDRDKEMLREVLSGCKYEEIAINHSLSLSSVKKRLAFLYKKVGVTNQIDFIIKFTGKNVQNADSTKV